MFVAAKKQKKNHTPSVQRGCLKIDLIRGVAKSGGKAQKAQRGHFLRTGKLFLLSLLSEDARRAEGERIWSGEGGSKI